MKVLVVGADGFIGREVTRTLAANHDVYGASRDESDSPNHFAINLLDPVTIADVLNKVKPEVVINCAGVIDATQDVSMNEKFTMNLLQEIVASGLNIKRITISGSASEYGVVDPANIPVSETAPLNADKGYGLSKVREITHALQFAAEHNLPLVVARLFNPLGVGMHPKFLTSQVIAQISGIKAGNRENIEVGRLDARRDYISVHDVAHAIKALVEHDLRETVYNVGSGKSTTTQELVELLLDNSGLANRPQIVETATEPEPLVAIQADIARIQSELGWQPIVSLQDMVKEITDAGTN